MGKLSKGQIEMISVSALNMSLCNFKEINPNINWNDKEPSWDGNIYLYQDNNHKKSLLKGKIPVQVKGTEVKKFERKFVSFQMELSDIKNYYNDGGVLFVVIQIISNTEYRIFYRFLLPVDLKNLINEIAENGTNSKAVHINNILNEKSKFNIECDQFLLHRNRQGINLVEMAITLDQIKDKQIEFVGDRNLFNMLNKDVYFYTKDEFEAYIPIIDKIELKSFAYNVERNLIINDKKYFDNFKLVNYPDRQIQIIGDEIEHDITNNKITIKSSTKDIVTRLNTIEFIEGIIDKSKEAKIKNELKTMSEHKKLILDLVEVCEKFSIPKESIKLSEMTINDSETLKILINTKSFSEFLQENEQLYSPNIIRVDFFGNKILLICIEVDKLKYYIDYFEEDEAFDLISEFEGTNISMGKFSILNHLDLLSHNFNINIVKKSIESVIGRCNKDNKIILSEQYNLLALESIKAWDISGENDYLDLAEYILEEFEYYLTNEIFIINKSQIEKRKESKLSEETKECLYELKCKKNLEDDNYNEIMASIDILLDSEEYFKFNFKNIVDKKKFMDYPIYNLYINNSK